MGPLPRPSERGGLRIDQLDKADAPPIPEVYIYLLSVQCLVSLSDSLAAYVVPLYNTLAVQKRPPARLSACVHPVHSTRRHSPKPSLPGQHRARDAERRLASPARSPLLPHPPHKPLRPTLRRVLSALQALARAATPRDVFLMTLAKAPLPPRVVATPDELPQAQPTTAPLSPRGAHTQPRRGWRRRRAATTAGAQPTQSGMRALVAGACFPIICSRLPQVDKMTNNQRSGNFGIAQLGGLAVHNMQRLVYRVAWDAITSQLLFVLRHPAAPQPIRVQAAHNLDDIFAIVPRHLAANPSDLQAAVQRRMLDVLVQQVMLDGTAPSTSMELRRLGLKALHQILPDTPSSSVGKRYSKCSAASAGAPLPTSRPPLGYLQEKGSRQSTFGSASAPSGWAVWATGGHKHRIDGSGEPLLGRL
jgi:hypothetical protein